VPVWKSARRSRRKGALTMGLRPRREAYTPRRGRRLLATAPRLYAHEVAPGYFGEEAIMSNDEVMTLLDTLAGGRQGAGGCAEGISRRRPGARKAGRHSSGRSQELHVLDQADRR
jgi:hypothetical protein